MSELENQTTFNFEEGLLDQEESRKLLGNIGTTKFYELLAKGEISAQKIGRRTFVKRSELNRYINQLPNFEPSGNYADQNTDQS